MIKKISLLLFTSLFPLYKEDDEDTIWDDDTMLI